MERYKSRHNYRSGLKFAKREKNNSCGLLSIPKEYLRHQPSKNQPDKLLLLYFCRSPSFPFRVAFHLWRH
uniref:Uncharacterized protein n=1 Tax=Lepeophtheirus salmonis TaxID=72036 RepID=A0A0K2V4A9_LEPSM